MTFRSKSSSWVLVFAVGALASGQCWAFQVPHASRKQQRALAGNQTKKIHILHSLQQVRRQFPIGSILALSSPAIHSINVKSSGNLYASIPGGPDSSTPLTEKERSESPLRILRLEKVDAFQKKRLVAVTIYFALWYLLSIGYNIYSKKALNLAPGLAWTTAWCQMALGLFYVVPLWMTGIRKAPKLTKQDIKAYLPVGLLHSLVHVGGVVSMSAGAVSFTYIVKASEPAVSALLSAFVLKAFLPVPVYLTLLPVMAGVGLASVSELSFTWKSFNYAMLSNIASASRGIVGKATMTKNPGNGMNAMNVYAVLTTLSAAILLPIAALLEGRTFLPTMKALFQTGSGLQYCLYTLFSAFFYYTYNEVAFLCLDNVSPVSHALGNTLKRVFIITSSMLVFGNKMTMQGIVGSTMAVGGVFLYSLTNQAYKKKNKREQKK